MVIIFLGSKSDLDWGQNIAKYLAVFGIPYKIHIASAHKTPEYLLGLIKKYEKTNRLFISVLPADPTLLVDL